MIFATFSCEYNAVIVIEFFVELYKIAAHKTNMDSSWNDLYANSIAISANGWLLSAIYCTNLGINVILRREVAIYPRGSFSSSIRNDLLSICLNKIWMKSSTSLGTSSHISDNILLDNILHAVVNAVYNKPLLSVISQTVSKTLKEPC